MKRSKRGKKLKLLILASIIIIVVFASLGLRNLKTSDEEAPESEEISLNLLISNELSNLEETKKLDSQIERFMREWQIKGASLAVMKDEKLIYSKGYGWADEETGVRMEPSNILRIASLSKLITATGIMKLVEDSLLTLQSRVFGEGGILPFPSDDEIIDSRVRKITIEHLLRHQGGFTLRAGDPMFSTTLMTRRLKMDTVPNNDQIIRYCASGRLGFQPGNGTRYSNLGYVILSRVIEEVTGMSYDNYIKNVVLKPIGITDMHLANNFYEEKYPNESRYYEPSNEPLVEAYDGSGRMVQRCYGGNNIKDLQGAGAWVASPSELLLFVASIDGKEGIPDILSKESIAIMTSSTPQKLPIGWAKVNSSGEWSRTGTLSGSSALLKCQKNGITWVLITNTSSWKGARFPRQIDNLLKSGLTKIKEWPERNLFELKILP
ncbi:MAG: serine hydrolase domain-containing protein [Bacteroidales bacterium]|jgi:CubicO group peptidase (beta-lactamase class C family)|nr:serine hydrolase domain-containing protein [Bacteroidales bacterium]